MGRKNFKDVSLDNLSNIQGKGKPKRAGRGWLVNICALLVFFQFVGGVGLIDYIRFHVTSQDSLFWLSVARHPVMMIIVHALILTIVIRHSDLLSDNFAKKRRLS